MPMMLEDLFFTFVIVLGIVYALAGMIGGFSLGEGSAGVRASVFSFGLGAAAAGILLTTVMLTVPRLVPEAALLYPVLAAGMGGYLLGRHLERSEKEEE
ncbi:hypothetical protein [Nitratifractor salsuginis]|uniref:Inner-membrane translocator n=1 Tax=Nitratifractor salsuginis (strain DSM 16511 / JCM 12458 / E9I37-1) TaxID=749222 RepID=E6WXQ9_NITSE|nr:hypothetical protein [Nitratifractor salsuginis]ADV46316.1 inner-membrane translocator [Nitratifractor salsuginis DSM 16511]